LEISPQPEAKTTWLSIRSIVESILLGVAYGVSLRLMMRPNQYNGAYAIMSIGFLFLGPLTMGILVVRRAGRAHRLRFWQWVVLPWLAMLLTCVAAMLLYLEGNICVIFALPIALFGATVGGVAAGLANRSQHRISRSTAACLAVLPVLIAFTEPHLNAPLETRTVSSQVLIHAAPEVVWQNVERVPAISPSELRPTWAQRVGFPRPVEATLSFEGIGGIRHASFERGLMFIETVTAWDPNHRIAFTIKADTAHIPPSTLDEHVTIGGRYFDVLDGEYRLEPLSGGDILLHLTSHQRISTDFNGYAGFWSDAVMQNLQSSILQVIQHRCESPQTSLSINERRQ
jgi:uncharacterized membrane protein YhaH (DUF805 family)